MMCDFSTVETLILRRYVSKFTKLAPWKDWRTLPCDFAHRTFWI